MKTMSFDQMETVLGGKPSAESWVCNLGLGTAGAILAGAAGAATFGAGLVVGIGWAAFQTWLCDKATEQR